MKTIASVSGGLGSLAALKLALEQGDDVEAVFADVKGTGYSHFWSDLTSVEVLLQERFGGESRDTYRFLYQIAHALDIPIERLEDGRSIWAVFAQYRAFRLFVNGRFFCKASDILKREVIAQYIEKKHSPGTYRIALGMGVLEPHRIKAATGYWRHRLGWDVEVYSPIAEHFTRTGKAIENCDMIEWCNSQEIELPEAYKENLIHNNCNEVCSQAGQTQYAHVYRRHYDRYMYAAWQEYRIQTVLGVNATILKDERGGKTRPMSLLAFADRVEAGDVNERNSGGSCACFTYFPVATAEKPKPHQLPLFVA